MSAEFTEQNVIRAQEGCRAAFDALTRDFYQFVRHIVQEHVRHDAEADEVTQEVFLRAYRKLHQLKEPAAFPGWLKQIAVRLSINQINRRPPERAREPALFEQLQEAGERPGRVLLEREDAQQLRLGISRLGQVDRQTLVAFYFEGRSLREMAEDFGRPVGTIKRRLHTARNRLKETLTAMQPA